LILLENQEMLKKITLLLCLGALPFAAQAAKDAPVILGSWVGLSHSAVMGGGQHHPDGKADEIRFRRVEFTLTLDRQEGRNFSGSFTTANHKEAVVGAIAADLKSGVMTDMDGQMAFRLVGKNRMDLCYTHTSSSSRVAACNELVRK
jgi:hypothetical protein